MSGHIDVRFQVDAPLDVTWAVAGESPGDHGTGQDDARPTGGNRTHGRVRTPPDGRGRSWSYQYERIVDPERKVAYSRRWGAPEFRYSYAFWQYRQVGQGSEIRCVADFEMELSSPVPDAEMEAIMAAGTKAAMSTLAERILALVVGRGTTEPADSRP